MIPTLLPLFSFFYKQIFVNGRWKKIPLFYSSVPCTFFFFAHFVYDLCALYVSLPPSFKIHPPKIQNSPFHSLSLFPKALPMIVYPNAKINLGLRILRRNDDGFHDLETVFYPVGWCDLLEILPATSVRYRVRLTVSGSLLPGISRDNLVRRAALMMQERYRLPPLRIHLHKQIPAGAGLGGGSSDAAFTLRALNDLFGLDAAEKDLRTMALSLGSDAPFFLMNRPALATGRGERLTPLSLSLAGWHLLIIYPALHLDTAGMFRRITPRDEGASLREIISLPPEQWRDTLRNDFEKKAGELHPVITEILVRLYDAGALYASLSGSGSAVYGLFRNEPPPLAWPDDYMIWQESIKV